MTIPQVITMPRSALRATDTARMPGVGGNHGVGQVQTGLSEGSHGGHGDVLTLGEHVGDVGAQDGGDIAKHGDGDHIGGQRGSQLQVLTVEQADEEVGNGLGGAGILYAHSQNGTQHDGDTQAAKGITKALGQKTHGFHEGEAVDQSHTQTNQEQCKRGMQLYLHNQHHQNGDGDYESNEK